MIKRIKNWCNQSEILKAISKGLKWTFIVFLIGLSFHIVAGYLCYFSNSWSYNENGIAFLLAFTMLSALMVTYLFSENYQPSPLAKKFIYTSFSISILLASYASILRENSELAENVNQYQILYLLIIFIYVWITRTVLFFNQ